MKKRYWLYICIAVLALLYMLCRHVILYVWVNPYTNTEGMQNITPIVYKMNNILNNAKSFSHDEGYDYEYSFFNIYGSGFMNNNPIPNDLDTEVSLYLGEYEYNDKNADEIAQKLLEKIESFLFAFYYFINKDTKNIQTGKSAFDQLALSTQMHDYNMELISNALPNVVNKKNYTAYSPKVFELNKVIHKVDYPYSMGYNEILLTGAQAIPLFSDKLSYYKSMPKYPREISVVTEYTFDLKYKNSITRTKIIPESYFGARLNISRRFFASSAFVNSYSINYLKKEPILNDLNFYNLFRAISYKRHLQEIETILETDTKRTGKLFKRIMQTADMIYPVLDKKVYDEISDYVRENLSNKDIQLLNEYENIAFILKKLEKSPSLFFRYLKAGKIDAMYNLGQKIINQLHERKNVDKKYLDKMQVFQNTRFKNSLIADVGQDLYYGEEDSTYDDLSNNIGQAILSQVKQPQKINEYIALFNNIFAKAGYHRLYLYWLDNHTLGYIEDEYTKEIRDFSKFAIENDLANFEYKKIKPSQIPEMTLRYDLWVRNNTTKEQDEYYRYIYKKLDEDRNNFKIKRKFGFAFIW